MKTVKEITRHLAERTRPEMAAAWDPVGLQIGVDDDQVRTVGVCHEVTEAVVSAVEEAQMDLLITYHPLLFAPTNRLTGMRSPEARALRLIRSGAGLLVIHTDFDAAPGGTADALAAVFDLRDIEPFGADEDAGIPPIGRVGSYSGNLDTLDARAADLFGSYGLRVSGDREVSLDKVAVIPGSGGDFIEQAAEVANAIVTGDVSHHRVVHALDLGLSVVDPGHIATERPGMTALLALASSISDVEVVDLTHIDPETWS